MLHCLSVSEDWEKWTSKPLFEGYRKGLGGGKEKRSKESVGRLMGVRSRWGMEKGIVVHGRDGRGCVETGQGA